jgi:hypothetical protein
MRKNVPESKANREQKRAKDRDRCWLTSPEPLVQLGLNLDLSLNISQQWAVKKCGLGNPGDADTLSGMCKVLKLFLQ